MHKDENDTIVNSLGKFIDNKMTIKFCDRFDGKSNVWNFSKHSHDYFELIYFVAGKATITTDSEKVVIALYDMIIYPPGVIHQEHLDLQYDQEVICIGVEFEKQPKMDRSFHLPDKTGEIKWLFERIYSEKAKQNELHVDMMHSYMKSVFLLIRRHFLSADPMISDIVLTTLRYIQDNFQGEITLDKVSSISCVSKSYLSRLFKKETGLTIMQYVNYYRIDRAKRLMKFSNHNITEIGSMVGFEEPKYFSRMFKQITGVSPKNFKKQLMEK